MIDDLIGVPSEEADAKLLSVLWELKHPFVPLFVAVFEANASMNR